MVAPRSSFPRNYSQPIFIALLVFALRLPFLNQAIQGDDPYYLYGAEHAQIDPLHPHHARYLFQGDLVDMRGFPHPPLNAWILSAPLAVLGDIREAQFHFRYILFSLIAALSMWSLARRFSGRPFLATLLFLAVPAFVINGNSLEADLPFLAFWLLAVALFVKAVDTGSIAALGGAAASSILAGLASYQAIFLTPVLGLYLYQHRKQWIPGYFAILAAPAGLAAWQLYELATSGALPAAMLAGYMRNYSFQSAPNKWRSAVALLVHTGWIVSPLIVFAAFARGKRWLWAAGAAAIAACFDPNPLFWISVASAVLLIAACIRRGFLEGYVIIFFLGSLVVFFAGSARYLLPIAAPVAILAVEACRQRMILIAGFALQMAVSLGLAIVNYQHWDAYRQFAASLSKQVAEHRVWVNAEWGLRYYLESEGALAMPRGQLLQPGEIMVSSTLALPLPTSAPFAPLAETEIRPAIPLRIISLDGRSAYSVASPRGLLPFEISTGPIDRVRAQVVLERKPQLTSIDPRDANAAPQIVSGLFPDGWMSDVAIVLLKRPAQGGILKASIYIPDQAPARRIRMIIDGQPAADQTFPTPGVHAVSAAVPAGAADLTVTLSVDQTFSTASDQRKLGVVLTRLGFD